MGRDGCVAFTGIRWRDRNGTGQAEQGGACRAKIGCLPTAHRNNRERAGTLVF